MQQPINLMEFMLFINQGGRPEQILMTMLENRISGDPIAKNLLQLAQNNDKAGIESVARNIAKEKGVDFDTEFTNFKKNLGLIK